MILKFLIFQWLLKDLSLCMCVSSYVYAHNSHRDQRRGSDALMPHLQLHEPPNVGAGDDTFIL